MQSSGIAAGTENLMEPDEEGEFDSGPYCRHWGDPVDCDEKCAHCGHECCVHWALDGCQDCNCEEFMDK